MKFVKKTQNNIHDLKFKNPDLLDLSFFCGGAGVFVPQKCFFLIFTYNIL